MALLNNADIAMYQAKEQGRNNFKFFTPSMHEEIMRYHRLETDLKHGLAQQQFRLLYQPQLSLHDHRVHAVEALRWNHPVPGVQPDGSFRSRKAGASCRSTCGCSRVCRQLRQWNATGPLPRVAINVAPVRCINDFTTRSSRPAAPRGNRR
jgi:predicted signal transduction protein with EAL and GGDEF domain